MMEQYIGFDIDDKKTVACVVQKGKKDRYDTMRTDVEVMKQWLMKQRQPRTKLAVLVTSTNRSVGCLPAATIPWA